MVGLNAWDPTTWGGQDVNITILATAGDVNFNCAIQVNSQADYDSRLGGTTLVSRAIINQYGGHVYTPTPGGQSYYGLTIGGGASTFGNSYGMYNLYGGLADFRRIRLYFGEINIYGGTMQSTDGNFVFTQNHPENKINVNGGTLRIAGNWMNSDPNIPGLVANGRIVSRRGGTLSAPYFDGSAVLDTNYPGLGATIISGTGNFNCAWNPIPDINATNVHYYNGTDTNSVTLTWNRGEPNVVEHYVYFGTSYTDVYSATTASSQFQHLFTDANQGDPCSWVVSGTFFTPGASYYWRVDENSVTSLNDDGSPKTFLTTPGLVWKFTAHDGNAVNIQPLNGQIGLKEPLALTWTKGDWASGPGDANALGHRVFFGTNSSAVGNAWNTSTNGTYRGTVSSPVYPLSRLTETGPNPPGASWSLTPGVTCYWRIDEVNTTTQKVYGGKSGFGGNVWQFTPTAAITIEDFEDYNNTADVNANWKKSGPCPGLSFVAFGGNLTYLIDGTLGKHGSFAYNNQAVDTCQPFSEVNRPYIGGTVFTGSNILSVKPAVLRVDYVGAVTNSGSYDEGHEHPLDTLYVALEDTAGNVGVYYNTDPNGVKATTWQQWYIPLNDPNFSGVTMTAISNFYLGVGLRCNDGGHGSTGTMMFDNIRLYAQTCNPNPPFDLTADMDRDCDVDVNDLDIFANDWLEHAEDRTFAITPPADSNLILWYKFNDHGDSNASPIDYGKTGTYTGTVINPSSLTWKPLGRDGNNCLYLPPGGQNSYVEAAVAALSFMADGNHDNAGGGGISVSVWINADTTSTNMLTSWNGLFGVWDSAVALETLEVHCPAPLSPQTDPSGPRTNFIKRTPSATASAFNMHVSDYGGKWNHWAFTKEPLSMKVYWNGNMVGNYDSNDLGGDPNINEYGPLFNKVVGSFRVGTRGGNWGMWNGYIQDFKVWDYCLSPAEVAYLATDSTGTIFIPLISHANLKSSGNPHTETVDFQDLSVMGDQWHQLKLWP
jgi:hypothetical protein